MPRVTLKLLLIVFALAVGSSGYRSAFRAAAQQSSSADEKLFAEQVLPVLNAKCQGCHNQDAPAGGLDLTSRAAMLKGGKRGASVVPGDAAKSLLFQAIAGNGELKMPPGNTPLPAAIIAAFRQWIDAGANWNRAASANDQAATWKYKDEDVWAFKPITRPVIPTISNLQSPISNPLDAFLQVKFAAHNLTPAPPADRVTLLRRATFDLHGLPPTPEEVAAFVNDKAATPKAFAKVVERLLASPRYGERWGRHWLDVVRYADTAGGSNDYERPQAWRYRDYVIRSFNKDKPFDQFIIEQIAGDELDATKTENLIATGFLRMGPWEHTAMSVEAVTRQEWLDDVTHNTATVFLGLTMGCAKCHDHKFDPLPTKDYYSLQAAFAATYFEDRPAPFLPSENLQAKEQDVARLQPKLDRALARQKEVSDALGIKPRSQPPNQGTTANPAPVPTAPKPQAGSDIKRYGADEKLAELREQERAMVKRVEFGKLALKRYDPLALSVRSGNKPAEETFVLVGGNLSHHGAKVAPAVPSAPCRFVAEPAPTLPATNVGRRLALAKWIASKDNPLTARVIVNRVWQWHFGKGLVETSNNFGKLGQRPTHPELLDWLAANFLEQQWSIKSLHRLLMNSAAYQRSSRPAAANDQPAHWLASFPARRLEAEELRDAMLAVAGALNSEAGGVPTFPELNTDLVAQPRLIMGTVAPAWEASLTRAARHRRTIYTFQQRSLINPLVEVFNGASANESCEFRRASTIAPQVFNLFNSQFSADIALAFAARLQGATKDQNQQIARAFQLVFQRAPTAAERQQSVAHLQAMTAHHKATTPPAWPALKPTELFINSEFTGQTIRFVEDTDFSGYERNLHPRDVTAETRALAELCLVLLNANEFVYVY